MKKVIVFGGAGFIGSHVAEALINNGYEVSIFDIRKNIQLPGCREFIRADILDRKKVEEAVKDKDAVYNFAGEADIEIALQKPVESLNTNIIGNAHILEACRKHKVKRFIFASTLYVYGNSGSFYRSSKQACELIIEDYHRQFGLGFTILRYGTLYGPRSDTKNWLYAALQQALVEKKITRRGDGEEIREYIHVHDAARLSVKVLDEKYCNQYVVISGNQPLRIKDLMLMIKEILNNEVELEFIDSDQEQHYEITPYKFSPTMAKKIFDDHYIDLGQGILNLLNEMYAASKHRDRQLPTKR